MKAGSAARSEWAKRFEASAPFLLAEAMDFAETDELPVYIQWSRRDSLWVVVPAEDVDFWLDSFSEQDKAKQLVSDMGWRLMGVKD